MSELHLKQAFSGKRSAGNLLRWFKVSHASTYAYMACLLHMVMHTLLVHAFVKRSSLLCQMHTTCDAFLPQGASLVLLQGVWPLSELTCKGCCP